MRDPLGKLAPLARADLFDSVRLQLARSPIGASIYVYNVNCSDCDTFTIFASLVIRADQSAAVHGVILFDMRLRCEKCGAAQTDDQPVSMPGI